MRYVPKHKPGLVYFAECDMCGHYHPDTWCGKCEEDDTVQYTVEDLDARYGKEGWALECFAELELVPDDEEEDKQRIAA